VQPSVRARRDRPAGFDRDPLGQHRIVEDREQRCAVDADANAAALQCGVAHVEDAVLPGMADQPRDRRAARDQLGFQSQRAQHGLPCRLYQQARAERAGAVEALEQGDAMAVAVEQQGGGKARSAASCHRDVARGQLSPPPVAPGWRGLTPCAAR
jgi:hypothetical protein